MRTLLVGLPCVSTWSDQEIEGIARFFCGQDSEECKETRDEKTNQKQGGTVYD